MRVGGKKRPLIIRLEKQVRELDPKLLFACVENEGGFAGIKGGLGPGEGDERREVRKKYLAAQKGPFTDIVIPTFP